jgi:hypothetical protein
MLGMTENEWMILLLIILIMQIAYIGRGIEEKLKRIIEALENGKT